jgi:hypothetical protein
MKLRRQDVGRVDRLLGRRVESTLGEPGLHTTPEDRSHDDEQSGDDYYALAVSRGGTG